MIKKSIIVLAVLALISALALFVSAGGQMSLHEAMELDRNGRSGEAVAAIQQIIKGDPANFEAHMNLGLVYFKSGQFDNALAEFSKTLQLRGDNPMAYYFMGMIYEAKGQKSKALGAWQNYLTVSENSKVAMSESHGHIGISKQESIERTRKHIKVLKEELENGAH